jgi:hypothetical protein
MLIKHDILGRIVVGEVTLAFRTWERPNVLVGTKMRTAVGLIEVVSLDVVTPEEITDTDARAAGFDDVDQVLAAGSHRSGDLYRIGLRYAGPDERIQLQATPPSPDEVADIDRRLGRLDRASSHGAWTHTTLLLIRDHPGRRAADLAAMVGREKQPFKVDVRKLKELGLTESLRVGYRLSPRGRTVVDAWSR